MSGWLTAAIRTLTLVVIFSVFLGTQSLIATRPEPSSVANGDQMLVLLEPLSNWFWSNRDASRWLLIVTSLLVDVCGIGVLILGALGRSTRPIVGISFICFWRQICVMFIALPTPYHTLFIETGVPSALVTYKTANDFFFSGHTAISAYAAIEFPRAFASARSLVGESAGNGQSRAAEYFMRLLLILNICLQMFTVLVLRAHYSMDVVCGLMSAMAADWAAVHTQHAIDPILTFAGVKPAAKGNAAVKSTNQKDN